jgi:N-acetyl-D-muramate 6-phosphate phosphatase
MIPQLAGQYKLAVASAGDAETVANFLKNAGLTQYFTVIATALTCSHTKPFPDPLIWAAHQLGVLPEECVMIGDTTVDILAGQRAGMQTIGVLCGFGEQKELADLNPNLLLTTTALVEKELIKS